MARLLACLALFSFLTASPARAITVTEPPDHSQTVPGTAHVLEPGTNTVSGTVTTGGPGADSQDNFQVTVPAGMRLTQVSKTVTQTGPPPNFSGFVQFNQEALTGTGTGVFPGTQNGAVPYPLPAGTYPVNVAADLSTGVTWSVVFTVDLAPLTGLVLTPTAVITTSQWVGPTAGIRDNMINGSGLSGGGSDETKTHDADPTGNNVWHAGPSTGGIGGGQVGDPPFGAPPVAGQAVEFDLGADYDLTGAHVWNMNQSGFPGRGVKDVQILVSSSTSGAFTPLTTTRFDQDTNAPGLAAQIVPFSGATNVRRVRFTIQSAWSGLTNDYVGLSEVRFRGTASVPPNTAPSFALPTGPAGEVWTPRDMARNWFSITSSSDGNKLAAVVESGQIYTSSDSGATWTARETNRAWRFITSSADGSKLAAVVSNGQIYTSIDSGVTWTARESNRGWESITSSSDGSKLAAVVANGQIYTSIDSGVTWTARESNRLWLWITSSADGSKLAATVGNGQIYTSTDSGVSWTARDSDRGWSYITSSADGSKLAAVVGNGRIYTSADSGVTWTPRDVNRGWIGITSSADGSKLAALVHNGQIYTSTDSGATWTPRESNRNWRFIASSADGGKLVAIVPSGQIYTSVGANDAVRVAAGSGAYTQAAFATAISPGPATESTQSVTFQITANTNAALFTTQPAIASNGTLSFTPGNTPGVATVTVTAMDNGGTANGGADTSAAQTFTITVTATVPGAPVIGTATAGNASASVDFTAPASNGGSAITSYTVTSSPGGLTATGATSPINVTGLTNGTPYTFTVRATNAAGQGAASLASNSVTPTGGGGGTEDVTVAGINLGLIPDNNLTGRDIEFNVAGRTSTVTAVSVQFTLSPIHTYAGDLSVQLIAPDNTIAQIFSVDDDDSDLGGPYTFQDSAARSLGAAARTTGNALVASGTYRAANDLTLTVLNTVFAGKAANGTWKLRFNDGSGNDIGTVSQASLTLTTVNPYEVTATGSNLGLIPDNNPTTGRDILFNIAGTPGVVKTVSTQFTFNPGHTYQGDLRIELISPSGIKTWIYEPTEVRGNNLAGPYTIADTGSSSFQTASIGLTDDDILPSGTFRAAQGATLVSLNLAFAGASPNGTWRLRFRDLGDGDTGSVSQASLTLTTAKPGLPTLAYQANGSKVFTLTDADLDAAYLVQGSGNLTTWIPLASYLTLNTGALTHTDTTARGPRYFYRAVPFVPEAP